MASSKPVTFGLLFLTTLLATSTASARADDTAAVASASSEPSTRRVVLSAGGATLIGVGLPDFRSAGGVTVAIQEDWAVHRRLRLGLAQAITATSLPYGDQDGEPMPFRRSDYDPSSFEYNPTFPLRLMGTVTLDLDRVQLDAGVGASFLLSSTMGIFSILPSVVAQVGVTVPLGAPDAPVLLRLGAWRSGAWGFEPGQSVIVPELSLGVRL